MPTGVRWPERLAESAVPDWRPALRPARAQGAVLSGASSAHRLTREIELLAARFAHSHSGSQFLPQVPSHWYSDILPPHCGQTRLRIDEMMRRFNSPGGASMVLMFEVLPKIRRGAETGQNDGSMPRGCCALGDAPNWLAAESVHASRAAPSLSMK